MAVGSPGADSSNLVTRLIDGKPMVDVAAELIGQMPVLWGRYFTSVAATGLVEYRARRENQALRERNIRVLPIARQTRHVDGTQALGSTDAQLNVEDLIKTFGVDYLKSQGGTFIMFLDVEGAPSLSTDYYVGWARTAVDSDLLEWDPDIVQPNVKIPCEVLLWQYADECHGGDGFDCNETNPNVDLQDILSQCVLPPETLVA